MLLRTCILIAAILGIVLSVTMAIRRESLKSVMVSSASFSIEDFSRDNEALDLAGPFVNLKNL